MIAFDHLTGLELTDTQPPIYDRPIGERLLYHDPLSGAVHYLIRYPAGLTAQSHRHTHGHTIVVLEGRLQVGDLTLGPGSYCHFPAGEPMRHQPAPGHSCLFITLFDGPFDVFPTGEPVRGDG